MKVLVCGGRDYCRGDHIFETLDKLHAARAITQIIEGGARGADSFARYWAIERSVPYRTFKADWMTYGNAAGSIRNERMLKEGDPDLVIAFPGGAGTRDMVMKARHAKKRLVVMRS
jgi:hypothetical protein